MYVAMENLERVAKPTDTHNTAAAVSSRILPTYFSHFDWHSHSYVPHPALTYQYPDNNTVKTDGPHSLLQRDDAPAADSSLFCRDRFDEACKSAREIATVFAQQLSEPLERHRQEGLAPLDPKAHGLQQDPRLVSAHVLKTALSSTVEWTQELEETRAFFGLPPMFEGKPCASAANLVGDVRDAFLQMDLRYCRRMDRQLAFTARGLLGQGQASSPLGDKKMVGGLQFELGEVVEFRDRNGQAQRAAILGCVFFPLVVG